MIEVGPEYQEVLYLQFSASKRFRFWWTVLGVLSWPVTIPLALLAKSSDILFRTASELVAMAPYFPGVVIRYQFYRFALRSVGTNVVIEFGTVFIYKDVEIGDNVLIGRYNIIHHCDFGNYVLTGERCTFLSGSRQHRFDRRDKPMALQGGQRKRIRIEDDVWVGSHAVVAEDVATGSIVAMGAFVNKPVAEHTIAMGNPVRFRPRP